MTERKQLRGTDVKRLNRTWRRGTKGRVGLIVESVTQPFNIGSIARSAAVFGVEQLWLSGNATPLTHPNVGKTALGTERLVKWEHAGTSLNAVKAAKAAGFTVVALELTTDGQPIYQAELADDICLAIGGEDHGCSPALLQACDTVVYIPQIGKVGSLNVAVAAAVALAEIRGREWAADPSSASAEA